MDFLKKQSIDKFLNPKTIAVIGATTKPGYGQRFLANIINNKYQGKLFPVNPKYDEFLGYKCYPSVSSIEGPVDLAVVIVKAQFVEKVVEECAKCHVGACLIITAGFSEYDKENGKAIELRMKKIAEESGMRIIGPNTIGSANIRQNIWINAIGDIDASKITYGNAAIISQSGAAGFGPLLNAAIDRNVALKYIVTTGNEADLGMNDFIDYMLDDDDIHTIGVLIEGIKDSKEFINLLSKAQNIGKKLILMKLGESSVGARAALSHTASMTGDMTVFNAMVKQYGAIKAEDYDELVEYTKITRSPFNLTGKTLCVVSHSGGISGYLGDQLGKYGFNVPVFSEETQKKIDEYLKGFGSPRNPLDLTTHMSKNSLVEIMRIVEANETVDGYIFATHNSPEIIEIFVEACNLLTKPYYLIWTGSIYSDGLDVIRKNNIPLSFSISKFAKMLSNVYLSGLVKSKSIDKAEKNHVNLPNLKNYSKGYLNEVVSKNLVSYMNLSIPESRIIAYWDEFNENEVDFDGPYALKIISDTIIHKSDEGGVILNLNTKQEIKDAYNRLMENFKDRQNEIQGVLLEKMCPAGLDIMVGVRVDPTYGPVLLVGLGGIYTELFKMVSLRLVPVSKEEIERMLGEIPGLPKLLAGYRGNPAYDRKSLVDAILKISEFVEENKDLIELLEVNPIRVMPGNESTKILDCVIKIK
ncbi:MAG: acetate--CoA ligase family protein [Acetivibrionales bacterium]